MIGRLLFKTIFTCSFLLVSSAWAVENIPPIFDVKPVKYSNAPSGLTFQDTLKSPYKELKTVINQVNIGETNPKFNGSILVGYQGKLIYEKAFGVANRSTGLANTMSTPTQVASITKTFTGTSIVWLQEKGFLNIKDNVQKYLWEFPYSHITIEHLLSHRSGLKDYLKFSGRYWNSSQPMYNEEVLNQFRDYKFGLNFTPGSKFDYSNSNYAILALIIERVSGMSYKKFIHDYIFEPLDMQNSFVYDPADKYPFPYARSYRANFSNWQNTHQDGVYGDKGIYTTAEDLYKWDQALYSNDFLSDKAKEDAFTPRSPWEVSKNYGLGWRLRTFPNGEKYAYHTGWWHGYQGIFSRYIKDDFTVIILSNRFIHGISKNSELIYETASTYLPLTDLHSMPGTDIPDPNAEKEVEVTEVMDGITIASR
ncbi:serine hydrolase [Flavobacteriaceae bacterium Ap0902]|nr:serine hydrolase [Flavobacteriaceae bacterium Ap0902]